MFYPNSKVPLIDPNFPILFIVQIQITGDEQTASAYFASKIKTINHKVYSFRMADKL